MPHTATDLMTADDLCAHLDISRATLYRYMSLPDPLPSMRPSPINRHRRMFDPAAVDAWMIRNRWSAPAPECTCTITQWGSLYVRCGVRDLVQRVDGERMEDHACPVHFPEEDLTPAYGIERPVA